MSGHHQIQVHSMLLLVVFVVALALHQQGSSATHDVAFCCVVSMLCTLKTVQRDSSCTRSHT
eukprot:2822799-Amphidinium_carterae.1